MTAKETDYKRVFEVISGPAREAAERYHEAVKNVADRRRKFLGRYGADRFYSLGGRVTSIEGDHTKHPGWIKCRRSGEGFMRPDLRTKVGKYVKKIMDSFSDPENYEVVRLAGLPDHFITTPGYLHFPWVFERAGRHFIGVKLNSTPSKKINLAEGVVDLGAVNLMTFLVEEDLK